MFILRAALALVSVLMLAIAAGLAVTLFWWSKWPPSDPSSDLRSWLFASAFLAGAILLGGGAVCLGDRRWRARLAAILPYPMNNDG